jgi:hypothetical protein
MWHCSYSREEGEKTRLRFLSRLDVVASFEAADSALWRGAWSPQDPVCRPWVSFHSPSPVLICPHVVGTSPVASDQPPGGRSLSVAPDPPATGGKTGQVTTMELPVETPTTTAWTRRAALDPPAPGRIREGGRPWGAGLLARRRRRGVADLRAPPPERCGRPPRMPPPERCGRPPRATAGEEESASARSRRRGGTPAPVMWQPAQENTVLSPKTDPLWSLNNSKVSSCR